MCGIAGWLAFNADLRQRTEIIDRMTDAMKNRGPDMGDSWVRQNVALCHRRLAVIDIDGGQQPMEIDCDGGSVALVYSGEVYNFRDLRQRLEQRGHVFRSRSDTEVVLRGYLEWGESVVDYLNGMYAFAIWDERKNQLMLVRDRMGVKPLYFHRTPDGILFGSEPKAILANPNFPRIVDTGCLRELVGFTKAPGWAMWKDMYELEPGSFITVTAEGIQEHRYWQLETRPHEDSQEKCIETVRELLNDIVSRQLISDVPQCVLLSGGLDSSAITGLASSALGSNAQQLRTFSVDFDGLEEDFQADELRKTSDAPFIRDMVAHVGSNHNNVMLDSSLLMEPELRRAVVSARDMPIGLGDIDSSMYLLFKEVRKTSTVALSGEFADELFGGYPWFHHPAARDADTFPWLAFQSTYTADRTDLLQPDLRHALDISHYVADEYATAVAKIDHPIGEDPLETRMRTSSHLHITRLVQAMLDRKDRMSMAVGLEVRVPFADHRLVEYVYNTPWSLKCLGNREKGLLRSAVDHILPKSISERVKSAYPSTQDPKYAAALHAQVRDILADTSHPMFGIIDPAWLRESLKQDAATVTGAHRTGLERALDLYHWCDIYQPELRLN